VAGRGEDKIRDASGVASDKPALGIVVFSRGIMPSGSTALPGASGAAGAAGARSPEGTDATGSTELVPFEVRRSQSANQVELVDATGRVVQQVPLLAASGSSGQPREASAPREDREDATGGAGDPLGDPRVQDPQGKERGRSGNAPQTGMDDSRSSASDWSVAYASIVHQICCKEHGK
jgi:hypothetical protein